MGKAELIRYVEEQSARNISDFDFFKVGDNVAVSYKIVEGDKERIQVFRGDIIQIKGQGLTKSFTIRKVSHQVGVERIFPFNSPMIVGIQNLKKGRVRRAKLFYLRNAKGKSAVIREKRFVSKIEEGMKGKRRKLSWGWEEQKIYK
jgi:large subunit ribosomal protein L19